MSTKRKSAPSAGALCFQFVSGERLSILHTYFLHRSCFWFYFELVGIEIIRFPKMMVRSLGSGVLKFSNANANVGLGEFSPAFQCLIVLASRLVGQLGDADVENEIVEANVGLDQRFFQDAILQDVQIPFCFPATAQVFEVAQDET